MRALCWNGVGDLRVETVPDPTLLNPHDAILEVRLSSVCGSDLHLLNGYIATMRAGDIIGHEFLGTVLETGPEVRKLKKGDRVVCASVIGCGGCWYCQNELWSLCDNTNTNPELLEPVWGDTIAGVFGYSHALGGYAGSHAEYIRVPFADNNCFQVPDQLTDEQALFVSDAFPTGYMGADLAGVQPGGVVAVWGCGGVGQMAIKSAYLLGAERVIAIDRFPERLRMAEEQGGAEVLDYEEVDILEALREMTGGRGPDHCIEAVGMEAHGTGPDYWYDRTKQALRLETGRSQALRQAIVACRKGGTVALMGVFVGVIDKFPIGAVMNKALTIRTGQQHGQRYAEHLLQHIVNGDVDPSYIMTHRLPLEEGARGYEIFNNKEDGCVRVAFAPA